MNCFKVLGVDQGLASCGIGIIEFKELTNGTIKKNKICLYKTIKTYPKKTVPDRLLDIFNELKSLVELYKPEYIGCEQLFYTPNRKGQRNKSSSILNTNMVTGLIFLIAGIYQLKIKTLVPGTVKLQITNNGKADKILMMNTICEILNLDIKELTEHSADALCIAYVIGINKNTEDFF